MKNDFYKFPSTPHLALLKETTVREDKVLSEEERRDFLKNEVVVEEKVDGANLGISFDATGNIRLQNRGALLSSPYLGQWKKLPEWLPGRMDRFFDGLTDQYILFGEWVYARHTVFYCHLPDWFLGFDIFSKKNKMFLSCEKRDRLFSQLGVAKVPLLGKGYFPLPKLTKMMTISRLSDGPAEGLYLRMEQKGWIKKRAKLVRPRFLGSMEEHWTRRKMEANRLNF